MEQSKEGYNDVNGKVKWNVDTINNLFATYENSCHNNTDSLINA